MAIAGGEALIFPDAVVDTDVAVLLRDAAPTFDEETYHSLLASYQNPVLTFLSLAELLHLRHLEETELDREAWEQHILTLRHVFPTAEICNCWGYITAGDAFHSPLSPSWHAWQVAFCLTLRVPLLTDNPSAYAPYVPLGLQIKTTRWSEGV